MSTTGHAEWLRTRTVAVVRSPSDAMIGAAAGCTRPGHPATGVIPAWPRGVDDSVAGSLNGSGSAR